jgi:outer membrane receptor protein involved in Fe transport
LQPATGSTLTGQPFPLPAWSMSAAATYALTGEQIGLPVSELAITASAYNQSNYRTDLTGYHPSQKVFGYTLANLRIAAREILGSGADLSAGMTNVFNKKACFGEPGGTGGGAGVLASTPNATFGVPNTSGITQCVPLPPRMVSVTLRYAF